MNRLRDTVKSVAMLEDNNNMNTVGHYEQTALASDVPWLTV